jgi:hypothetical protein
LTPSFTIRSGAIAAAAVSALLACTAGPHAHEDPAAQAKAKHDEQLIKKMQSYVGWNIGSFMSDWSLTPAQTTTVAGGNEYQFVKQQDDLKCTWTIRTNSMGNIVRWSMRGNACPNADGP